MKKLILLTIVCFMLSGCAFTFLGYNVKCENSKMYDDNLYSQVAEKQLIWARDYIRFEGPDGTTKKYHVEILYWIENEFGKDKPKINLFDFYIDEN